MDRLATLHRDWNPYSEVHAVERQRRAKTNVADVAERQLRMRVFRCAIFRTGGNGGAYAPPNVQTGMPSFLALSARLAEMPEPGKTMTPIGTTLRI